MAKINKSQFAILGMLSLSPMSGYEIRRAMEKSTNHFWKESDGQLYPTLEKLVKEGKINRQQVRQHGARKSHIYELTPDGQQILLEWLMDPGYVISVRSEFMLKIFFGGNVAPDAMKHLIESFYFQQKQQLQILEQAKSDLCEKDPALKKHIPYWKLCIRFADLRIRANMQWCEEILAVPPSLD